MGETGSEIKIKRIGGTRKANPDGLPFYIIRGNLQEVSMGCVYIAENVINKKVYIGKTIYSLERRKYAHEWQSIKNPRTYFHKALNKNGCENFTWKILYESEKDSELLYWEKHYISIYNSDIPYLGYNGTIGGESGIPTQETRKKLREAQARLRKDPEFLKKIKEGQDRVNNSEQRIKKLKENTKKLWENKEYREKVIKKLKSFPNDEKWKKAHKEAVEKLTKTKEWRDKTEAGRIKVMATQEWKDAHQKGITEMLSRKGFLKNRNEKVLISKKVLYYCVDTNEYCSNVKLLKEMTGLSQWQWHNMTKNGKAYNGVKYWQHASEQDKELYYAKYN